MPLQIANHYDKYKHRRRSIRLKGYDYSEAAAYFVTICTHSRECLFGDVVDGEMLLNDAGHVVHRTWNDLPVKYPSIGIDEFVVMPNHVHGIVMIVGAPLVGAHSSSAEIGNGEIRAGTRPAPTLGDVVGAFKSITTHQYADGVRQKNWPSFNAKLWQRNYYEHIIRSKEEMNRIRGYIIDNPVKWDQDEDNPENTHGRGTSCGCPHEIGRAQDLPLQIPDE
jgi:putative transposase